MSSTKGSKKRRKPKGKTVTVSPEAYEAITKGGAKAKPARNQREQVNVLAGVPINA